MTWPPDYARIIAWRNEQLLAFEREPWLATVAKEHYKTNPTDFINHWCVTVDPRNALSGRPVKMPFFLFPRQEDFVHFLKACLDAQEGGLVEKSRDMGATWLCCAFSVWLWLFYPGSSVGWGSRKADLVDTLGDPDSIFEKIRVLVRSLPPEFLPASFNPKDHMTYMKVVNTENGASITGESGDNIGRGGRKLIYFKDESAHYERPESIEAALTDNTRVQIDISSVGAPNNIFHRKRDSGIEWSPGDKLEKGRTAVFVMDWRDHPEKDQAWYNTRRQQAEDQGLLHLFAQEVDRDYSASIVGTVVPLEWVKAATDVHLLLPKYGDWFGGGHSASLDVADEGGDRNALCVSEGVVVVHIDEWGERDTGATARRAIEAVARYAPVTLQYDCIGVGAGVKAEANRLRDEKDSEGRPLLKGVRLVPWNAGTTPINPEARVVPGDRNSPLNKDFYGNLKAQGWWELRWRFERTYKLVMAHRSGKPLPKYDVRTLISISSKIKKKASLEKELNQVVRKAPTGKMKLIIDKKPEGTTSPNLADCVMMDFWPVSTYDTSNRWVA